MPKDYQEEINNVAQALQDMYFATGARVSKLTWEESLRILTTYGNARELEGYDRGFEAGSESTLLG